MSAGQDYSEDERAGADPRVIRIGTSGWSYPTGRGTWNGVFYPWGRGASRRRGSRPDELSFYADHFDTVEVNSSFYRIPSPDVTRGWAKRTPKGFEFSLKLFQKFTHPEMFRKATGAADTTALPTDVDAMRAALDPLAEAGKLGALLAQFPPSFKDDNQSREHLAWILDAFRGYQVAVELRHRSWSDRIRETLTLLGEYHAAWVQIDEPKFRFSIRQNLLPNVKTFYYLRLHGRNAAEWWKHNKSEDRYNYEYSAQELEPFAETADAVGRIVGKLYLYFNNHFSAKSVANAAMIKHRLGLPVEGVYPPAFVERFPHLGGIVQTSGEEAPRVLFEK